MMMKRLLTGLTVGAYMMISTTVFAITIDGTFDLTEWSGHYADDDGVGASGFVGPGYGGQQFDAEYLGLRVDAGTVYFGLQTGFNLETGVTYGGTHYGAGDLALDVNNNGIYDYAIRFDLSDINNPALTLYNVTTWQSVMYAQHAISDPYRYATGSAVSATFISAYNADGFDNNSDGGTSYVLEGSFALTSLGLYAGGPLALHWTMECGNDYLNTTTSPVPEPGTLFLLGFGIVSCGAWGLIRRRRTALAKISK